MADWGYAPYISLGTDPEGFFKRDGVIIGSGKVIQPVEQVADFGSVTRDGVQFELHPKPSLGTYIEALKTNINRCLMYAFNAARRAGATVSFDGVVDITRDELDSLPKEAQELGCQASLNTYGTFPIKVSGATYLKRSAGGHVHIGVWITALEGRERLVSLADTIIGNTCVLLDRDAGAVERRKNYGRAGEYRLPVYGVEYRTTSNFWLRDPVLTDFVFKLAITVGAIYMKAVSGGPQEWNTIADNTNISAVRKAINTNNYKLARENFDRLYSVISKYLGASSALEPSKVTQFLKLSETIEANGIESVFPEATIEERWNKAYSETFNKFLVGR